MTVKAIPAGHHTVTPYLAIKNAVEALEFYKKAFGATESFRLMMPDGRDACTRAATTKLTASSTMKSRIAGIRRC